MIPGFRSPFYCFGRCVNPIVSGIHLAQFRPFRPRELFSSDTEPSRKSQVLKRDFDDLYICVIFLWMELHQVRKEYWLCQIQSLIEKKYVCISQPLILDANLKSVPLFCGIMNVVYICVGHTCFCTETFSFQDKLENWKFC